MAPVNPTVHIYGALRNIMMEGKMVREVELSHLDPKNLYALGALENLEGEILILDGMPFISIEENEQLVISHDFDRSATLLVASYVERWDSVLVDGSLEEFVPLAAKNAGLDSEKPFPFMLKGNFSKVDWHVVNWPANDDVHTHEKHQTSGPHGSLQNVNATVLGFYSAHHHGVFTHHSTNLHMHVLTDDQKLAAHADEVIAGKETWLFLPVVAGR